MTAGAVARENVTALKVLALYPAFHGAKTFKSASTNHVSSMHTSAAVASPTPCACARSTVGAYFPSNLLDSTDRKYTYLVI